MRYSFGISFNAKRRALEKTARAQSKLNNFISWCLDELSGRIHHAKRNFAGPFPKRGPDAVLKSRLALAENLFWRRIRAVPVQDLTPQLRTRLSRVERAVGIFVSVATLLLLAGFG